LFLVSRCILKLTSVRDFMSDEECSFIRRVFGFSFSLLSMEIRNSDGGHIWGMTSTEFELLRPPTCIYDKFIQLYTLSHYQTLL
jgi:hypothetical protein